MKNPIIRFIVYILIVYCLLYFVWGCAKPQSYLMPNDWWTESYYSKDCSFSGVVYTTDGTIKQCVEEK